MDEELASCANGQMDGGAHEGKRRHAQRGGQMDGWTRTAGPMTRWEYEQVDRWIEGPTRQMGRRMACCGFRAFHFGVTLGSLWDLFGVTLEHFGVTLGSL